MLKHDSQTGLTKLRVVGCKGRSRYVEGVEIPRLFKISKIPNIFVQVVPELFKISKIKKHDCSRCTIAIPDLEDSKNRSSEMYYD